MAAFLQTGQQYMYCHKYVNAQRQVDFKQEKE